MLLDGYDQDAGTSIAAVDESLAARDYPRVHEALHALRGYAVEVGASAAWSISSTGSGRSRPSSCRNLAPGPCWRLRQTQRLTLEALRARLEHSETAQTRVVKRRKRRRQRQRILLWSRYRLVSLVLDPIPGLVVGNAWHCVGED
jgi:hypothetical protein